MSRKLETGPRYAATADILDLQPVYVEVNPSGPDTPTLVWHGLGRIPRGYRVVRSIGGESAAYENTDDPEPGDLYVMLRFTSAARVLLEVF